MVKQTIKNKLFRTKNTKNKKNTKNTKKNIIKKKKNDKIKKKSFKMKGAGGWLIIFHALKSILSFSTKLTLTSGKGLIELSKIAFKHPISSTSSITGGLVLFVDGKKYLIPACALWNFVYNIKLSPPIFNWERNAPFDFYSNINQLFYNNNKNYKESFDIFLKNFLISFEKLINNKDKTLINKYAYNGNKRKHYFKTKVLELLKKHDYEFSDAELIISENKKLVYQNNQNNETVPQRLFNLIMHEFDGMTCDINTPTLIYEVDKIKKKLKDYVSGKVNDNEIPNEKFFSHVNVNYNNTGFDNIYEDEGTKVNNDDIKSFIYPLEDLREIFNNSDYRIQELIRKALDKS